MAQHAFAPTVTWYIVGAMVTALSPLPVFLTGGATPLSPLPLHTLLLLFLAGGWIVAIIPTLFVLQFWLLHDENTYLTAQIWFLGLLWVLTPFYFWSGLEFGLRYMGVAHVAAVFTLHVIGLILLSLLAWVAHRRHPSSLGKVLNILSFFYFFWAAFPIFGELP